MNPSRGRRWWLAVGVVTVVVLTGAVGLAGASAGEMTSQATSDTTVLGTESPDGDGTLDPNAVRSPSPAPGIDDGTPEGGDEVVETDENTLETTYATVEYHEDYREDAESVAHVVDDHVRVLYQKFGEYPGDGHQEIYVGPSDEFVMGCEDFDGCVDLTGTVYLSSDSRSLLHHELVHVIQIRNHWTIAEYLDSRQDPDTAQGAIIEGTARYLDSTPESIAAGARFDPDAIELTPFPTSGTEYDERALFAEFVLAEYDRAAFDALILEGDVEALEETTGEEFAAMEAGFYDGLDDQEQRLQDGGPTLPAFTAEPFVAAPGEEVTLDARTPEAVAAIDREWYPTEPDEFAWDLTGDGEVDETGPTATHAFEDAAESNEVTLFVTVDGERHEATQPVLVAERFELVDVELPENATAGEVVEATVTVENQRDRPQSDTVQYGIEDGPTADTDVELDPGESTSVSLTLELPEDASGTLDQQVSVGGHVESGSIAVSDSGDDADDADDDTTDSIPGFGIIVAAGALLVAAMGIASRGGW